MSPIQAWADAARQVEDRQDDEHQRAIDTFQGLLQGDISSSTAAEKISSIYNPLLKQEGTKPTSVIKLWHIFSHAVRVLGGETQHAERLTDLLNSIAELPDVADAQGNAITPEWKGARVYWRDLPQFAMIFREFAIETEPDIDDSSNDEEWNTGVHTLLNATTFAATYLAHGRPPRLSIGMSFHAEVSLMLGIEVPWNQRPTTTNTTDPTRQLRLAGLYVPPAATWILIAGSQIHALCKADHDRKDGAPGVTPYHDEWLWGKGRGYSSERWAFWKKRFGEIAETEGEGGKLGEGVRNVAATAAEKMGEIDDGVEAETEPTAA